ncbi:MAG: LytTR family transcriptional regulator, partial [Bacteroidales bacterium]|nr:LytTR family transcriptional regulator [Bacteroidales bacterium]
MKTIAWLDIIFGVILMPLMMFLFPIGDWVQWHSSYVLLYIGWLYLVFFLCRKALGPVLLDGKKGYFTVLGVLFLTAAATFLMSLTPVEFPRNPEYGTGLAPHIRAMWIMLIAVVSYGIPVGMLSAKADRLSARNEADQSRQESEDAVRTRAEEVVRDDDILVKSEYKTIHIPVSAIQYIEGRNNYACFHLDHRDDVVSQIPLKDVLELMPPGTFVRIHR